MGYSPASAIPLNTFGAPTGNISMNSHKFTSLLDGSVTNDSAGWDQLPSTSGQYAYVVSGCVWTADSPGSTLNGSMTAGIVVIGGLAYSVGAVSAHAFAASSDTYVDINIQSGAAVVNYTAVANNTISPALVSSGTFSNTVRNAVVVTSATAIVSTGSSINQGVPGFSTPTAQGSTTVAAGSNGSNITATPLNVAASTSFPSGGGYAQVAHSGGQVYVIKFTGTGSGTLTGVTVLAGSGTVSTGDTVTGITPLTVADTNGNLINPSSPYPRVIGYSQFLNAFTTTTTSLAPVPGLVVPFVVPAGPAVRLIKMVANVPFMATSAAAGTAVNCNLYTGNLTGGVASSHGLMAVASDGWPVNVSGVTSAAPGSFVGTAGTSAGAAGTTTIGGSLLLTTISVELV